MTRYTTRRGVRTGVKLWRVQPDESAHQVTPDGVLDLMWFRDRLVVAGPDTHAMTSEAVPAEVTWGLQFAPGVAAALLGLPAAELTDRRVELSDLVKLPGNLPHDPPDRLEQVFLTLWRRADPDPATLRLAAELDRAARAGLSVRETARTFALSERSLRRLSNTLFGYGTKTLTRIHRFQRALGLARAGVPLGEAAATSGFADQAHFTRDARQLTGRTPAALSR
ncbi:MAG: helix-turn-helix domain-containing protein [Actinoplanes sp.]